MGISIQMEHTKKRRHQQLLQRQQHRGHQQLLQRPIYHAC
jgi:hypothetical protein